MRSGGSRNRDRNTETEYIRPGGAPAPPVAQAQPVQAPPTELSSPGAAHQMPTPVPAAPMAPPVARPAPASAGATRLISVPGAGSSGVVGVLVGVDGELKGEVYKVFDGENAIGRDEGNRVVLRSEYVSGREHAIIIHQDNFFGIKAPKPDRPVHVNGERVEQGTQLSDGDTIAMGQTTLKFRVV